MAAAEGSGMVQRGLVLLALIGALAVTLLLIMFRTPAPPIRAEARPELLTHLLCVPGAGFPGGLTWAALYQLSDGLPSPPGWEIRYTATRVLAKRGSPQLPLPILCEMLDETRQMRNFRAQLVDGRIVADEGAAYQEILIALKAVGEWHQNTAPKSGPDDPRVQKLAHAVAKLTHSQNNVVRGRAQETLLTLKN